jgi:hypothetical protein
VARKVKKPAKPAANKLKPRPKPPKAKPIVAKAVKAAAAGAAAAPAVVYAHVRHTLSNLQIYEGAAQQNGKVDATKDIYIRGNCEPPYNDGEAYASVVDSSYYWWFSVDPSAIGGFDWEIYIPANTLAAYGKDFTCTINRTFPMSTAAGIEFSIQ